jgi:hypothetical protein
MGINITSLSQPNDAFSPMVLCNSLKPRRANVFGSFFKKNKHDPICLSLAELMFLVLFKKNKFFLIRFSEKASIEFDREVIGNLFHEVVEGLPVPEDTPPLTARDLTTAGLIHASPKNVCEQQEMTPTGFVACKNTAEDTLAILSGCVVC